VFVRVLGFREEGRSEWIAVALEMDLWGRGRSFAAAFADLADLVQMQVSFAYQQRQPEMIYRPADPRLFDLFHRVHTARLRGAATRGRVDEGDYRAVGLEVPPPEVIAKLKPGYALADA
jgi:hypothetical protein